LNRPLSARKFRRHFNRRPSSMAAGGFSIPVARRRR
jgi:hypothetical protein